MDIRKDARIVAARSRSRMVQRDLQQNPPLHHPVGTIVTLRIPKTNRNATQNRRLICRILAEASPGRYQLETEYGTLKNTFPASELDTIAETVEFQVKVPTMHRQITLNFELLLTSRVMSQVMGRVEVLIFQHQATQRA